MLFWCQRARVRQLISNSLLVNVYSSFLSMHASETSVSGTIIIKWFTWLHTPPATRCISCVYVNTCTEDLNLDLFIVARKWAFITLYCCLWFVWLVPIVNFISKILYSNRISNLKRRMSIKGFHKNGLSGLSGFSYEWSFLVFMRIYIISSLGFHTNDSFGLKAKERKVHVIRCMI